MTTMRLAVPTKGDRGMSDVVSEVFARAPYFTIIDILEGEAKEVMAEENTAMKIKQGAGPLVAKTLKENHVDIVVTGQLGPGAKTLLDMNEIKSVIVDPGTKVREAVTEALKQILQPAIKP